MPVEKKKKKIERAYVLANVYMIDVYAVDSLDIVVAKVERMCVLSKLVGYFSWNCC